MNQVTVKNSPPAFFRWLTCLAGIVILFAGPAYGIKCIATQHVEQKPSYRNGRHTKGFELYGPAAVVFGIGFVGLGLSMGYGIAYRFSRKTSFKTTRIDRFAIGLVVVSVIALFFSHFLPTRTDYGESPPDEYSETVD